MQKTNSKWFKDFNTDMRLLEKIWDTLQDKGIGKDFLVRALVAQGIRAVIDKWDPMKVLALTASVVYTRVVAHACHPSTRKVEVGGSGVQDCFAFPWLGFPLTTKPANRFALLLPLVFFP